MAQIYYPFDPSTISEGYGWADWRQGIHDGIDFAVRQGTELRSTASGIVRNNDAGQQDGAGIDITTDDGWIVRHWHVSKFGLPNGSRVEAGDIIGLTGGTPGTWGAGFSTGAHLHWGVKIGKNWVDPATLNPVPFGTNPTRKKKQMGAFYRTPDGTIYYQDKPNTAFTAINLPTWKAYEANGAHYAEVSDSDINVLKGVYGTY